jgi:hypothetical protein
MNCLNYDYLTVSSTAVGLESGSEGMPSGAKGVVITVEDADVRYRMDGTDPTTTEGHLLSVNDVLSFPSWQGNWKSVLAKIKFIAVSGDADLKISYFD